MKARRAVTLLKQLSRSYMQEAKSGISHNDRIRGFSAIDDINKFRDQVKQELSLISNELEEEFTGEGDTSGGDDFTRDEVLSEFRKYIVRAHDALRDNTVFEILPFSSDIVVKAGRVLQLLMRLFYHYTNTSNSQISEGHIYQGFLAIDDIENLIDEVKKEIDHYGDIDQFVQVDGDGRRVEVCNR